MNQAITTTKKQRIVNKIGEAGLVNFLKDRVQALPLTPEERFEEYYRLRESLKTEHNGSTI